MATQNYQDSQKPKTKLSIITNQNEHSHLVTDPRLKQIQESNYAALGLKKDPSPTFQQQMAMHQVKEEESSVHTGGSKPPSPTGSSATLSDGHGPVSARLLVLTHSVSSSSSIPTTEVAKNKRQSAGAKKTNASKKGGVSKKKEDIKPPTPKPKELLSDSQKKLNHVQSEQRRRANIKEGFDLLERLTPSLYNQAPIPQGPGNTGGGHSKQAVLKGAAEYIMQLQEQVELLKRQLASTTGLPIAALPSPQAQYSYEAPPLSARSDQASVRLGDLNYHSDGSRPPFYKTH
ncbi:hypothetical protein HDU91_001743 [Kappamyces sp. JEL0680]|nr:hypothetical protein HDU91_001743 [Kappamyces sp. JEL0680]